LELTNTLALYASDHREVTCNTQTL
jgi:hypothetical protein